MFSRSSDKLPPMRTGKAFIATLIGCSLIVAFGMLRQVELSNDQIIAIALICVACVVSAFVGEWVADWRRQEARERARDKKLFKAERAAAKKVAESSALGSSAPPPGTSFGSSSLPAPKPVNEPERPAASALHFTSLGRGRRANNRKFGRLPQEFLTCNLGEILDLSAGGMKVLAVENATGPVDVLLQDCDGVLALSGAIVWSKRRDAKHWEQGVEFDHLTPEDRRRLTELATNFRKRRTMCA